MRKLSMSQPLSRPVAAFRDFHLVARGPLTDVALQVRAAMAENPDASFLTFDDATGAVIDLDLRGDESDVLRRLEEHHAGVDAEDDRAGARVGKGRGRPKLGVVAREVTLLPRHWDWLARQPGGASQTLRRLVDQARGSDAAQMRSRREAAYRFMSAMAGNLPGFEEASRALFAGDRAGLEHRVADWPTDVRVYLADLAGFAPPGHEERTA